MAAVTRFRALLLRFLFCALFLSHLGEPHLFGIGICMAEDESLPVAELRGEGGTGRRVVVFQGGNGVDRVPFGLIPLLGSSTSIQN